MPTVQAPRLLKPALLTPNAPTLPFRLNDTFFNRDNGRVKIYDWGTNFQAWFRDMEEDTSPSPLQVYVIPEGGLTEREIVDDLGGEEAVEMHMGAYWEQIALQGFGQAGLLPVNGHATLGFKKVKGVLRTVFGYWRRGGWDFRAFEFPYPYRWRAGYYVVAPRNS